MIVATDFYQIGFYLLLVLLVLGWLNRHHRSIKV